MLESSYIIRLNIRHYQALLQLRNVPESRRQALKNLVSDAEAQLPLAVTQERERKRNTSVAA